MGAMQKERLRPLTLAEQRELRGRHRSSDRREYVGGACVAAGEVSASGGREGTNRFGEAPRFDES